ncbi:metallophosphoesterase [Aeoliella sp. SH292]|uniref:metallophosphoesterase n=1 Tax=Aeoliella sp. SH292 TaxID=3454464 RepID=UPI003F9DAF8D
MSPDPRKVNRRRFLRSAGRWTAAVAGVAGLYAWRIEPHWLEIVERDMPLANLPANLAGKRVVHLTDIHVSRVVDQAYLERAFDQVAELDPDVVLVTGDLMTAKATEQIPSVLSLFNRLDPDQRCIVVTPGNHDYCRFVSQHGVVSSLFEQLGRMGVHGLRNQRMEYDGLQIVGCDEWMAGRFNIRVALDEYDPSRPAIAMTHNPDTVDYAGWEDYRGWILAGHTHGGQCRLPYFGAPIIPIRNRLYTAGEVKLDDRRTLYVGRGLGYTRRVRFLCSPEITVFRLTQMA